MNDNAKHAPQVWPPSATIEEVREFALGALANNLSLFVNGVRDNHDQQMGQAVAGIRRIATRLDQFRRMKAKQPPGAASPNPIHTQGDE